MSIHLIPKITTWISKLKKGLYWKLSSKLNTGLYWSNKAWFHKQFKLNFISFLKNWLFIQTTGSLFKIQLLLKIISLTWSIFPCAEHLTYKHTHIHLQVHANFPKILEPPQNSTCQKDYTKLVAHGGPTNIRCHDAKCSCPGDLMPEICAALHTHQCLHMWAYAHK
jgi:hypothetical protein